MSITILIVEDILIVQELLKRIVQRTVPSAHILTASNGEEGLQKAIENRLDLIITGLTMPKMDGYEMVYHLRRQKDRAWVPIIGMSGNAPNKPNMIAFRRLCDAFLSKPFLLYELQKAVIAFLASKPLTNDPRSTPHNNDEFKAFRNNLSEHC